MPWCRRPSGSAGILPARSGPPPDARAGWKPVLPGGRAPRRPCSQEAVLSGSPGAGLSLARSQVPVWRAAGGRLPLPPEADAPGCGDVRRDGNHQKDERHGDTGRRDVPRRLAPRPQGRLHLAARRTAREPRRQEDRVSLGLPLSRRRDLPHARLGALGPVSPGSSSWATRRSARPTGTRSTRSSPACPRSSGKWRWTPSSPGWAAEAAAHPPCCG